MERDGAHVPFVECGSYPLRSGNWVQPLVDGGPAFERICAAVEAARDRVWVTVAFHELGFRMPGGRGSLFDVLDAAVRRGIDVRVIFWRHLQLSEMSPGVHFAGTESDRKMLAERGARFLARWDQAYGPYCQHQKSWLVDCGTADEVAFVGGINLDQGSVAEPGHAGWRWYPRRIRRDSRSGVDRRAPQLRATLERGQRSRPCRRRMARCGVGFGSRLSSRPQCGTRRGAGSDPTDGAKRAVSKWPSGGRGRVVSDRVWRVQRRRPIQAGDRRCPH